MLKVHLSFVPPGGGESDYSLAMNMPALPRAGDYISVQRPPFQGKEEHVGLQDFIVRRVWWSCEYPDDGSGTHTAENQPVGSCEAWIECEFAIGPMSSEAHKRAAHTGKARSPVQAFEASMY